jgi:hypothetical protein
MQSLADFLGVKDTEQSDRDIAPPPAKMTAKAFFRDVLATREYRESLLRRIVMDELPAAVECMMWDRAHGKAVERVEVKDTTDRLEGLSAEQLEQRALFLADVAHQLRSEMASGDGREGSVH